MEESSHPFDLFLGYHTRDRSRVERIAESLSRERQLRVFLDRWYLVPGQPWPRAIERVLSNCGAAAICIPPVSG